MSIDSQQLIEWGQLAARCLVIVALGLLGYWLVRRSLRALERRKYISDVLRGMLQSLTGWLIVVLVVLFVLQQLGVEVAGLWAALLAVLGMVAIGFVAVWSILSNVFASVLIVGFRPFALGDEIEIIEPAGGSGLRGRVVKFNLVFTQLAETLEDGSEVAVHVPNNTFLQKVVRRRKVAHPEGLEAPLLGWGAKRKKPDQSVEQGPTAPTP